MGWFRSNRRRGGYLALFALVLQLALSFGHTHAEDFSGTAGTHTALSQAADPSSSIPPGDNDSSDHRYCDICATMALAGSLVLPQLPVLEIPTAFEKIQSAIFAAYFTASEYSSFKARAPPLA
jgi:hypothetical protein